jgi:hypothetical protein
VLGTIGFALAFKAGVIYVMQDGICLSLQFQDVWTYAQGIMDRNEARYSQESVVGKMAEYIRAAWLILLIHSL